MKVTSLFLFMLPYLILHSLEAYTQELKIFQDIEVPVLQHRGVKNNHAADLEPAFTLKATSKFGDNYHASLLARNGKVISVNWSSGSPNKIEDYTTYSVTHIGSRTVSLQLPTGDSCVEATEKGVSCSADGAVIVLRLLNIAPIQKNDQKSPLQNNYISNIQTTDSTPRPSAIEIMPDSLHKSLEERINLKLQTEGFDNNVEMMETLGENIPKGMKLLITPIGVRLVPDF